MIESTTSYWETKSLTSYDVAIIGGGITGLSVAASIKERSPNAAVIVFERSGIPYGASTRNAGFACFGSLTEVLSDIDSMGHENARNLLYDRWKGLQILRSRLGDNAIGYSDLGGYERLDSRNSWALDKVLSVNELVSEFIPNYIEHQTGGVPGLRSAKGIEYVKMNGEGQLDTGMLMRSLEQYCLKHGIVIRSGTQVQTFAKHGGRFITNVADSHRGELIYNSEILIDCTNAFSKVNVVPGRGQVFVTKPFDDLKFQGNLHVEEGFYYMRSLGNRILFGGGRNLDLEEEETREFGFNDEIHRSLQEMLPSLIQLDEPIEIEQRWSGIMAIGDQKNPIVRNDEEGLITAVRMGGMGVALASQIGEKVADLMDI